MIRGMRTFFSIVKPLIFTCLSRILSRRRGGPDETALNMPLRLRYNLGLPGRKDGPMEIRKDIAIIGGGPGGYLAAPRSGPAQAHGRPFRDGQGRRDVHELRLHPDQVSPPSDQGPQGDQGEQEPVRTGGRGRPRLAVRPGGPRFRRGQAGQRRSSFFSKGRGRDRQGKGPAQERTARSTVETPDGARVYAASKIILATGSRAASLPFLEPNGAEVVTSTEALEFS